MKQFKYNQTLIELGENVSSQWVQSRIDICIQKIKKNMTRFGDHFPSACTTNGIYRIKENDDWTNGFWTGMLWICYEITGDMIFYQQAMRNVESFQKRIENHYILDHHDIGFLYSLSVGAGYQITQSSWCKEILIQAADVLMKRYCEKGEFLQAWGSLYDPKEYRLIIDSLINLPLLFKATELSNNNIYAEIATKHYHTVLKNIIRDDATTYHTHYFDLETGLPTYGATHQGNSDQSIWARGQSWAVLGIPLNEEYIHSNTFPNNYHDIVEVFINHLPQDFIPYWDFDFTDENPSAKDSSALAIAASGLFEAETLHAYPNAREIATGMVYQLGEKAAAQPDDLGEGLLLHGVYAYSEGKGIDESNLWGDYFYLETLMRLNQPNWIHYW